MEYFFEHPVITGVVPVDNKELIDQLNNMELKVGQEINFKNTPPVYIKSIEEGMVILSKDKVLAKCSDCKYLRENHLTEDEVRLEGADIYDCLADNEDFNDWCVLNEGKGIKCAYFKAKS